MSTRFYHPEMLAAEHEIAAYIERLIKTPCEKIEPYLKGIENDPDQVRAVQMACSSRICLLYGRPGTGKTTTFNCIVRSFDNAGLSGHIMAPSAKAAKRSAEVIARAGQDALLHPLECTTIHRGLEWRCREDGSGGFEYNFRNPMPHNYIGIDEAGMMDVSIAADALAAIDFRRTRLVLLGDPHQLPSVGPGNVLHDLIHSRVVPSVELTRIHRTGKNSGIAYNASRILNGEMPLKTDPITGQLFEDFYFIPKSDPEATAKYIVESVKEKIPSTRGLNPFNDIQVLSPGKKSPVGTQALNKMLRDALNPGKEIYSGFRIGDKVINRKNIKQLGIVNGDVGRVIEAGSSGMVVDFGPGSGLDGTGIVKFSEENENGGNSLQLAYCFTVHASQGSEFPVVLMPCHMSHYMLLFRNLFYTGMTRAKNLSCFLGDIQALQKAVETSVTDKRVTGLQDWLRQRLPAAV